MTTTPDSGAAELGAVSRTALAVAAVRARESARADRLFDDPFAAAFVAAGGVPVPAPREGDPGPGPFAVALARHTVIRTRFYDDALLAACAGGVRQVVVLAAGLDTRAHRLPWPDGTRLYELDLPPVLAFKERVLVAGAAEPRCGRTALPADLLHDDWPRLLREAGFDPAAPTAWLVEGLLVYLEPDEAARVLDDLTGLSAPGSTLAVERGRDRTGSAERAARAESPAVARITSLWKGGLGARTEPWLAEHGWETSVHPGDEVAASYGRPVEHPSPVGFLTARRTG